MAQEVKKSMEQIKQEIEFYKESLKFLNSFYLPIGAGIVTQFVSISPAAYKAGGLLVGMFVLSIITRLKKRTQNNINQLIKQL